MSNIKRLIGIIVLLALLLPVYPVFAQGLVPCGGPNKPPCTWCDLIKLGQNIITFLSTTIAPVLLVLFIIYGGITIMTSGGSPARIGSGKKIITEAIISFVIVLVAWILVDTLLKVVLGYEVSPRLGPWNVIKC